MNGVDTGLIISSVESTNFGILKLYPNPAKEVFNLELNISSVNYCRLYNSTGQLIKTLNASRGINTYNISNLKAGLYYILISTPMGTVSQKLIKK